VRQLIETARGKRPGRIHVDPRNKGLDKIDSLIAEKQRDFLAKLGLERLFELA
jgi:hypothetical protein